MNITSLTLEQLERELANIGEPKYRAKQIFEWLHKKNVFSFEEMSNISGALREKLAHIFTIETITLEKVLDSKESKKYLFDLQNNTIIESVFMNYSYGGAVCVSTQAGCKMGCSFCASTIGGLVRNLTAGEMLLQVYEIAKENKVTHIVLMGSGEPLDNYEEVLKFIKIINSPDGLNIGQRHITLSTCGLTDQIYLLAEENLQITLAVSLHAPNDEIRRSLMPVAKKYTIDDLLEACKKYENKTKRRVTFEYAMIKGVNDSKDNAYELAKRLKHTLCHVNLIPVNEVVKGDIKFFKSNAETIELFASILNDYGIETTVRRKLGSGINAACGQLRAGIK